MIRHDNRWNGQMFHYFNPYLNGLFLLHTRGTCTCKGAIIVGAGGGGGLELSGPRKLLSKPMEVLHSPYGVCEGEGSIGYGWYMGIGLSPTLKLFPLPVDWKYFCKNIGLSPETGVLPFEIQEQINNALSFRELQQIRIIS